jgi:DNA-binding PadR family transcriptional regulator
MNDLILLAMLLGGPRHGYALKKQAGLLTGKPDLHNNLVYPLLRRFIRAGWVTQRRLAGERGQTRNVFSITRKGRQALLDRLSRFAESEAHNAQAFELRVGLFAFLGAEARREILARRTNYLQTQDARLEHLEQRMELGEFGAEVVRFKRERTAAELSWIAHVARKHFKESSVSRDRRKKGWAWPHWAAC